MAENNQFILVHRAEYERLCNQDGCIGAVQRYVDDNKYPDLEVVLSILDVDMEVMRRKREKSNKKGALI